MTIMIFNTVFIRLTALGAHYIFGPCEWVVMRFSPFSASVVCLFCNKTINCTTDREDVTEQGLCQKPRLLSL